MGQRNNAAIRAGRTADVLLQSSGRAVLLRMPAPATAGSVADQLGLAAPEFQDVELSPVVFRKSRSTAPEGTSARRELIVSATAVDNLLGSMGYAAASVLFATAFGVLVDGVLMEIETVTESEAGGATYFYRLLLHAPLSTAV
ncbi:MAG: hypothetical protein M3Y50_10030 [Acidobacteriota bacterium]|nr:hypothetical protein [Acidobacteriota bacterium]